MTSEGLLSAGIDVGAATAKAVILNSNKIISSHVIPTGESVTRAAESVMRENIDGITLSIENIDYIIATGYGRRVVNLADAVMTEISCHAKGVNMLPGAQTVIDIVGAEG